jgi:hypothetical protein
MKQLILPLAMSFLLAACSTPVVYAPGDREGNRATGSVTALPEVLRDAGGRSIRLVFVHGVGDHCAGYAIDPETGWLDDKTARQIGLTRKAAKPRYQRVSASVFMTGNEDTGSYMETLTQNYSLQLAGAPGIDVEAIEITWSHTTQWLKSNYLGYDSPSVTHVGKPDPLKCEVPENSDVVPTVKRPPDRLWLDRVIKEQVFDRNLADAIIYSGTYGEVIERGVADALCRAMVETPANQACGWSGVDRTADASRRYFFVTHSLGSRIVYDTMLDLVGVGSPGRLNKFKEHEWKQSRPVVLQMIANTPAFYMMANQLSLLGLANVPVRARSDEEPKPLFVKPGLGSKESPGLAAEASLTAALADAAECPNPMTAIAKVRQAAQASKGIGPASGAATLRFVAFNDTNDLLTWHIPEWYATGRDNCRPPVELSNVFVRNAFPWLVIERPDDAHGNYFVNGKVWQAIRCGAKDGTLLDCAR